MATITADTYLDGGTARTAGEAWTCNGGKLTVRTDTRWHANAPASMTGSLGSITISASLGGGVEFNATAVRWLPYDTGTGNVPAIGTTVSQGGVSGYLLGVWSGLTSAPTAVGAAMPASGFIKLREVTGGAFAAGALTGIGASATAADRTGWIEVVMDQAATITASRRGSGSVARGDWFYLDDTTGVVGQTLQTPTNGGGANTFCPGVWVETAPGSDEYEFWPGLNGSTNGWAVQHLGMPVGATDRRQSFVKSTGSGQMVFGESSVSAALTYTITSSSGTYTWANDLITVTVTAHGYSVGESVHLDFTTGGVTADGVYTVEQVTGANAFTVVYAGAGTGGNVTARARAVISYANHPFAAGNILGINASSGDLADGSYEVISVVTGASGTITIAATPSAGTGGSCTIEQTIGRVPEAGCKTRIPNIILRQCTTGARATNAAPHGTLASRPDFSVSGAGIVDHEYTYGDWYYLTLQAYQHRTVHVATYDSISINECATEIVMTDTHFGMHGALDTPVLNLTSNFAGGTFTDCKFPRGNTPGTSDHAVSLSLCVGMTFVRCESMIVQFARSTGYAYALSQCNETVMTDCRMLNGGSVSLTTCADFTSTGFDNVDRIIGVTSTASATYTFNLGSKCARVMIDGVTEGYDGAIARLHSYAGILVCSASDDVTLRNVGTRAAPLGSTIGIAQRGVIYASSGNNNGIRIQRCYVTMVRTSILTDVNSDKNVLYESVSAPYLNTFMPYTLTIAAKNATVRGCKAPLNSVAANASVYGTHIYDQFSANFRILGTYTWASDVITVSATAHGLAVGENVTLKFTSGGAAGYQAFTVRTVTSANAFTVYSSGSGASGNCIMWRNTLADDDTDFVTNFGRVCLPMNEPTDETDPYVTVTGNAGFTSVPGLTLPSSGDSVEFTCQYDILGHNGFLDAPPVITGAPAVQASTYTWAANVVTVTFTAHGLAAGDQVWLDATSGTLPDGLYTIAGITSANVYTISLAGSGTSGNANAYRFLLLEYQLDLGSGFGDWHNLDRYKAGVTLTAASNTVTMADTTGIEVGDKMYASGIAGSCTVDSIDSSTQITVDQGVVLSGSNRLVRFGRLGAELDAMNTAEAWLGFGLKIRVSADTPGSTMVLTYVTIPTYTALDLQDNLYPLDTNTLELTGLQAGTEVRVFDAGTTTPVAGQESVTGTFTAQIDAGAYPLVDIAILSLGYQNTRLTSIDMSAGDVSIPVQQIVDRQYANA